MVLSTKRATLGLAAFALLGSTAVAQTAESPQQKAPAATAWESIDNPLYAADQPTGPTFAAISLADTFFREDFADGFDGWTRFGTEPTDSIDWIIMNTETIPGLYARNARINTPTRANGYAIANFDFFETGGTMDDNMPDPYDQSMVTPAINLSTVQPDQTLVLTFAQVFRFCCTAAVNPGLISFSTDGGTTFDNEVLANPGTTVNLTNTSLAVVRIPQEYNGVSDLRIRFRYNGEFYFWAVDDIYVATLGNVELSVNPEFAAVAPDYATPQSQTPGKEIVFLTDVNNGGAMDQNVKLAVTIENYPGTGGSGDTMIIYTDTLDYGLLVSDSLYENRAFPRQFPMPMEIGRYRITYLVVSDSDEDDFLPANDTARSFFFVTERTFAKGPVLRGATLPTASEKNYEIGNIYYTPVNNANDQIQVDSVTFGFSIRGSSDDGDITLIESRVYGYRGDLDLNGYPTVGEMADPNAELVLLGLNFVEISSDSTEGFKDFTLAADETMGPVLVPVDQDFIGIATAVRYEETPAPGTTANRFFTGTDNRVKYSAYNLAVDTLGFEERYSNYVLLPLNASGDPAAYNFGDDGFYINAQIQMKMPQSVAELAEQDFAVRPNPASTEVTFDFDFGGTNDVTFTITNAIGQQVKTFVRQGLSEGQFTLPVNDLNIGLYYMTATTSDNRSATRKVLIQR